MSSSDTPVPPKAKGPGFGSRRGNRPLKLLKTLRGDGTLLADGRTFTVGYQLDLYADGERSVASDRWMAISVAWPKHLKAEKPC